ncbi:MAG: Peroxide stress regulator PerR, family [Labilithrix sp.]|nr:Peroxide stress regulator PerR, family [Labilithrix sp.]
MAPSHSLMADTVLAKLKRAGLKLTPQRMAIVRELADDCSHPTAQELFERLQPAFPTMSFATVYNTLDALAKLGLVGSLRLGTAVRFDPNTSLHHHAVCDACGAVVDLPAAPPSPSVKESIEAVAGFEVRVEERTYRGLCSRCACVRGGSAPSSSPT